MSEEENKAAIEFAGIKLTGSKLLMILPILSALGGALWGGFEFYKDYMDMKDKIQTYVAPDLSEFDKKLATLEEKVSSAQKSVIESNEYVKDIRVSLQGDIRELSKSIDANDKRSRELDRDLRTVANNLERDTNQRLRSVEKDQAISIKELEKKVDEKIQKAWENPLAK